MVPCSHSSWLHVSNVGELAIHDEGCFTRLLNNLNNARTQQPSLLFFVGQQAKTIALRELFSYNTFKKKRNNDGVNLRLDNTTIASNYPIFIVDDDSRLPALSTLSNWSCHESRSYRLQQKCPSLHNILNFLYAQVLFLFTNVICVFADDFSCLENIIDLLKAWVAIGSASHLPYLIRSKIVIVAIGDEANVIFNVLQAQDFKFGLNQQDLINFFSSIIVLYLIEAPISPLARHRRLKKVLLRHVDEMRQLRQQLRLLYSAIHLNRFLQEVVKHVALSSKKTFNFILTSRLFNFINDEYIQHLSTFVRLTNEHGFSLEEQASLMASRMLMDAYSSSMYDELSFP